MREVHLDGAFTLQLFDNDTPDIVFNDTNCCDHWLDLPGVKTEEDRATLLRFLGVTEQ